MKRQQTMTVAEFKRAALASMTEATFQREVIRLAQGCGWIVAHFRASRTARGWRTAVQGDGVGFPDLILLRDGVQVAAELKSQKGTLTEDQRRWLAAFEAAGVRTFVWRPADWSLIEEVLKR